MDYNGPQECPVERKFCELVGCQGAVALSSATAGIDRDEFMAELRQRNIGTGLHFRAVHLQKYYVESMGTHRGMLPNTEWNSDRICSLPLFPDMTAKDMDDVVDAIKDVLRR